MNVFLDLGSNKGKISWRFLASPMYSPDFVMHAFDANPKIGAKTRARYPRQVIFHKAAIWIRDGWVECFTNPKKPRTVAATILGGKRTGHLDYNNPMKVRSIDFSRWIAENFLPEDNIIVKCDIEGAEYEVFRKMIKDGTIKYIKRIYMERHYQKFGWPKAEDDKFVAEMRAAGLEIRDDYRKFIP